ncbi:hypothetical protein [Bradyrhizobium sp. BR 1432]|uniref:hypothetical protein n=1 Tax=Bradyrhizobium sp. BR 1432 TaxID=3447966 RepID=UPI003EE745AB
MPNISIDQTHGRAIAHEIGERLRGLLREEVELPSSLKRQMQRLRELDIEAPSIVPTTKRTPLVGIHRDLGRGGEDKADSDYPECDETPDLDQESNACESKKHIALGHGSTHSTASPVA